MVELFILNKYSVSPEAEQHNKNEKWYWNGEVQLEKFVTEWKHVWKESDEKTIPVCWKMENTPQVNDIIKMRKQNILN